MQQHLGFLKISSVAVKIAAWIFLLLGVLGSAFIFMGKTGERNILEAVINLSLSIFLFFFLQLISKLADLMTQIINELHKK